MPRQADPDAAAARRHFTAALKRVLHAYRWRVGASMALLLAAKVATVAVPLLLKRIIDAFSQPSLPARLPIYLLAGYAILRFASTLFNEARDLVFARVTLSTVAAYAAEVFAHLHALGPRFHARRQVGGLLPDIEKGTSGIAYLLGVGLFTIVPTLVEIGLVLAVMLGRYAAAFSVIITLTFLAYAGFTLVFTARRVPYQRRVNKLDARAKGRLADSLINHETVKVFGNEALEVARFADIMHGWRDAGVANQRALFLLHVGQSGVIAIGVAAIMLLAGRAVLRGDMRVGDMRVGDLVLINAYALQVCLPLNALGFVYRESRDAWVNAERLFALLAEPVDLPGAASLPPLRPTGGEVVFENVRFAYDGQRLALDDVSFRIAPGTTLAVVGRSGSGKSTLARLLLRFYDLDGGRILVDGQDIRHCNPASVRAAVGVVPQDTALFNDSIGNNIAYARPGSTHAAVMAAARAAQLHDFITSLPQQYDSQVGERGVMLSGGERQRIGIARAILRDPAILVFDEATSALDADAEHAIVQELDRLARGRTTLIVAHRLSTIVHADTIIVMDGGRLVEQGTHAELLVRDGLYAHLWRLQQKKTPGEPGVGTRKQRGYWA